MKLQDLKHGTILIQKKASPHTNKLHKLVVLRQYSQYSYSKGRCYTYLTCKTEENTYYPSSNGEGFLDGLVGTYDLSLLKRNYRIF